MLNLKTIYICSNCQYQSPKWQGKCPECGQWNVFVEEVRPSKTANSQKFSAGQILNLSEIAAGAAKRIDTQILELNTVLGGGIVPGSLILLGGDPGIGKSTLALQIALNLSAKGAKVLYVSGEESGNQIKMRSERISPKAKLSVLPENDLETILATLQTEQPELAIIDSIQTVNSGEVNGVTGGVSQLSFATNSLMRLAKGLHVAILIIGHVTKEGMLAGPKTIEHIVDTVLYLEGDRFGHLRLLRSSKNRFGSSGEIGVFEMKESGLAEVANPSSLFLEHRDKPLPGSCATAILEGNKVLLLEVQALTSSTNFGYPKRATSGFDVNRLQLLIAILQKSLKLNLNSQDVYVNVAGGFKLEERAADLPAVLAILSSFKGVALPEKTLAFGEVGLLGEIRGVRQTEKRLKEAEKLGFEKVFVGGQFDSKKLRNSSLKIVEVGRITDIIKFLEK